jgi:hypothetical protein
MPDGGVLTDGRHSPILCSAASRSTRREDMPGVLRCNRVGLFFSVDIFVAFASNLSLDRYYSLTPANTPPFNSLIWWACFLSFLKPILDCAFASSSGPSGPQTARTTSGVGSV